MQKEGSKRSSKGGRIVALLICACQLACGGTSSEKRICTPTVSAPQNASARRLVVAVVYDQLSADSLLKYLPELDPRGAVRTAIENGLYFERGYYPYAATNTAPGHATIHTGAAPREHGITANEIWNRKTAFTRELVNDRTSAVFGHERSFAGPAALRVNTVADRLKSATEGQGKVVSISLKDRAAIFSVGKRPDLVLWYDKTIPGFTTSHYYAQKLPAWFVDWQKAHPVSDAYATWNPRDAARLEAILGPDQAPGEGDYYGFGTHFPHDPRQSQDPAATFRLTPFAAEYMLDLALDAVSQLDLGVDATPDLLALSISGTDYVGHVFGPDSWEYVDHLIRIDNAVGEFLRKLSQQTEVAWILTSDHGVAPLPEKSRAAGQTASRIVPDQLVDVVESALDDRFEQGDWVVAYLAPFIYLSETAHAHPQRDRIFELACRILTEQPGVAAAYTVMDLQTDGNESADRLKRAAYLSTDPQRVGDVYVVPARYTINEADIVRGFGTNHGTPWQYDQQVPVLIVVEGLFPIRRSDPVDQRRIAPTLAALLGISPPTTADLSPLPGIL